MKNQICSSTTSLMLVTKLCTIDFNCFSLGTCSVVHHAGHGLTNHNGCDGAFPLIGMQQTAGLYPKFITRAQRPQVTTIDRLMPSHICRCKRHADAQRC